MIQSQSKISREEEVILMKIVKCLLFLQGIEIKTGTVPNADFFKITALKEKQEGN
jgi:hypothetical protein